MSAAGEKWLQDKEKILHNRKQFPQTCTEHYHIQYEKLPYNATRRGIAALCSKHVTVQDNKIRCTFPHPFSIECSLAVCVWGLPATVI